MAENRNRYSVAPLRDLKKHSSSKRAAPQPPRRVGDFQEDASGRSFSTLQVLLTILLPLFFVISLLVRNAQLFIAFSALSAFCLAVMWLMNAFIPNARTTLSVIHITMILVALFAVWYDSPGGRVDVSPGSGNGSSLFAPESQVSLVNLAQTVREEEAVPTQGPAAASQTQQRLDQFMGAWMRMDYREMVSFAVPSWVAAQENPERAMFQVRSNRTPVSYSFLDVSGSEADNSRTVFMQAAIDKNNSSPPALYNFQVLMLRINDVWYVDPNSLSSAQLVPEERAAAPTVTLAPAPTPVPNQALYYNPDGGSYYHSDPNCRSINSKYLPLKASFPFRDVNAPQYKNLLPCPVCRAPARP